MKRRTPYQVILSRHVTEKSVTLGELENAESNPSLAKCRFPKAVFIVHPEATKPEIARAIEAIYAAQKVRVTRVNTVTVKPKRRRVRGKVGFKAGFKKAVVTLEPGDRLEEV